MCNVCNGHTGCPVCSEEPDAVTCSNCAGTGIVLCDASGIEIPQEGWSLLPENERWADVCSVCDGDGVI